MVATSGARLIGEDAVEMLKERLLPLAALATPNIPEAEVLSGCEIRSEEDMETAARIISQTYGCSVLLKGGHRTVSYTHLKIASISTSQRWLLQGKMCRNI